MAQWTPGLGSLKGGKPSFVLRMREKEKLKEPEKVRVKCISPLRQRERERVREVGIFVCILNFFTRDNNNSGSQRQEEYRVVVYLLCSL